MSSSSPMKSNVCLRRGPVYSFCNVNRYDKTKRTSRTHTSFIGGNYSIPRELLPDLYERIRHSVQVAGDEHDQVRVMEPFYLIEQRTTPVFPLLFDFDAYTRLDGDDHLTLDKFLELMQCVQVEFSRVIRFLDGDDGDESGGDESGGGGDHHEQKEKCDDDKDFIWRLRAVVTNVEPMECSKTAVCMSDSSRKQSGVKMMKWGYHVYYPDVHVNRQQACLLRLTAINAIRRAVGDRFVTFRLDDGDGEQLFTCGDWDSVVDKAVVTSSGIRLLYAHKASKCPKHTVDNLVDEYLRKCATCGEHVGRVKVYLDEGRPYMMAALLDGAGRHDTQAVCAELRRLKCDVVHALEQTSVRIRTASATARSNISVQQFRVELSDEQRAEWMQDSLGVDERGRTIARVGERRRKQFQLANMNAFPDVPLSIDGARGEQYVEVPRGMGVEEVIDQCLRGYFYNSANPNSTYYKWGGTDTSSCIATVRYETTRGGKFTATFKNNYCMNVDRVHGGNHTYVLLVDYSKYSVNSRRKYTNYEQPSADCREDYRTHWRVFLRCFSTKDNCCSEETWTSSEMRLSTTYLPKRRLEGACQRLKELFAPPTSSSSTSTSTTATTTATQADTRTTDLGLPVDLRHRPFSDEDSQELWYTVPTADVPASAVDELNFRKQLREGERGAGKKRSLFPKCTLCFKSLPPSRIDPTKGIVACKCAVPSRERQFYKCARCGLSVITDKANEVQRKMYAKKKLQADQTCLCEYGPVY